MSTEASASVDQPEVKPSLTPEQRRIQEQDSEIRHLKAALKLARAPKDQLDIYLKRVKGSRERINKLLADAQQGCLAVGKKAKTTIEFEFKPEPAKGNRFLAVKIASKATIPTPDFPSRSFQMDDDLKFADVEDAMQPLFPVVGEEDDDLVQEMDDRDIPGNDGAPAYR